MGIEIGDSVSADGRAGEVVGFDDGFAIVRPFPIGEQQNTPGSPACFVVRGEAVITKKHFERTTRFESERQQLADEGRALARSFSTPTQEQVVITKQPSVSAFR